MMFGRPVPASVKWLTAGDNAQLRAADERRRNLFRNPHARIMRGDQVLRCDHEAPQVDDATLWALVDFGPKLMEMAAAGEAKYVSIEAVFNDVDRHTGENRGGALVGVAITTTPFITGMEPIPEPDGSGQAWVQVARSGHWKGHRSGEFTLDGEVFAQMVASFEADQKHGPQHLPLRWGHADDITSSFMGVAGWITALEVR